jgi:N-acetyl-1-D-myo-inositol-2-amino-2-deoxy-alpha-D-glucopyranoside deacetylase
MGTLLLVHAHPDDEAISTGGAMMKARADGHRVVLVTSTRGEAGEIYNMDEAATRPHLGEVRSKELEDASRILGVNRGEFLNYRDSGMVGTPENDDPRSFHQAPLGEAAGKLAAILREERPDVVVTYDADGTYGHPDHIKAHQVTNAALDLLDKEGWRPRKLYYTGIPRTLMQQFIAALPDDARRQEQEGSIQIAGTPDELITTQVDVSDYVDRKREAFSAHVTQNDPNSWFTTMADQIYRLAFGTEYYRLARGKPGSKLPENDLFAGIADK